MSSLPSKKTKKKNQKPRQLKRLKANYDFSIASQVKIEDSFQGYANATFLKSKLNNVNI